MNRSTRFLNGMISVGDQVHGDLMHLCGVCGNHAAIRADMACDFNIGGDCRPDQIQYFLQDRLNPDGQFPGIGLTAESQNLLYQITAPLARI